MAPEARQMGVTRVDRGWPGFDPAWSAARPWSGGGTQLHVLLPTMAKTSVSTKRECAMGSVCDRARVHEPHCFLAAFGSSCA